MKTTITLTALFAVAAFTAVAQAQSSGSAPIPYYPTSTSTDVVYAGGFGYHSSTAAEGYLRGQSAVIRAYGAADLDHSQAAVYWQQARSAAIQNDYNYAETYFAMRELNQKARAAEEGPRLTRYGAERISDSRMPERLTAAQYEPALGQLYWPTALTTPQFDAMRAEVDRLMGQRWSGSSSTSEIQDLAMQMEDTLTDNIGQMSTQEYLTAKGFLDSLRLEVTYPVTHSTAALASLE